MRTAILITALTVLGISAQNSPTPATKQDSAEKARAAENLPPGSPSVPSSATDPATIAAPAAPSKTPTVVPGGQKVYIIGAEDVLKVIVWNNAGMSGDFVVRPDGAISVPLVGDVIAATHTPQEVEAMIREKLVEAKLINEPHVSVGVTAVHSKKYYINGEVNRPGAYDLVVPLTVLEGLVNAGGFKDFANRKKIRIQRGTKQFKFNYISVSHGKDLEQNIYLEPGDQIFVP